MMLGMEGLHLMVGVGGVVGSIIIGRGLLGLEICGGEGVGCGLGPQLYVDRAGDSPYMERETMNPQIILTRMSSGYV